MDWHSSLERATPGLTRLLVRLGRKYGRLDCFPSGPSLRKNGNSRMSASSTQFTSFHWMSTASSRRARLLQRGTHQLSKCGTLAAVHSCPGSGSVRPLISRKGNLSRPLVVPGSARIPPSQPCCRQPAVCADECLWVESQELVFPHQSLRRPPAGR